MEVYVIFEAQSPERRVWFTFDTHSSLTVRFCSRDHSRKNHDHRHARKIDGIKNSRQKVRAQTRIRGDQISASPGWFGKGEVLLLLREFHPEALLLSLNTLGRWSKAPERGDRRGWGCACDTLTVHERRLLLRKLWACERSHMTSEPYGQHR